MQDRKYEYVIVGSGTGGGILAETLARRGKDVLVLERGFPEKNVGTFRDSLRYYDGNAITRTPHKSKEGTILWRTFMAGGSSVVSCANGVRCLETELAQLGIDLEREFQEMEAETQTSPIDESLLSEGALALQAAGNQLGYTFERMPKFICSDGCAKCGSCTLGCKHEAKWSALRPLAALGELGAEIEYGITVDKVTSENGKVVGVEGKGPNGRTRVKAGTVILAAGALSTPVILQRSGVEAGRGLFMDLFVNTYAATTGLNQVNEPQMTLVDLQFHKERGFLLSPYVNQPRSVRFIELGVAGVALSSKKMIGIMAKITDERAGEVLPDGSVSKPVTKTDWGRLREGAARAKEILAKAGGDPKSMGVSTVQGAHPGGTAAIGEVVDTSLETKVSGLFVCDASVLPVAPGLPPMLTIGALAKYLGNRLAAWARTSLVVCTLPPDIRIDASLAPAIVAPRSVLPAAASSAIVKRSGIQRARCFEAQEPGGIRVNTLPDSPSLLCGRRPRVWPAIRAILVVAVLIALAMSVSCGVGGTAGASAQLHADKAWMQNLDRYLNLSYLEETDRASFNRVRSDFLTPSLQSTYDIVQLLTALGKPVPNKDRLLEQVAALKRTDGAYIDLPLGWVPSADTGTTAVPTTDANGAYSLPPDNPMSKTRDTWEALTILAELGARPEDADQTADFLLSLECDDGTFLTVQTLADQGASFGEDARLMRIVMDTYKVVTSLLMLDRADRIPAETKSVIASEVALRLGEGGPFPTLDDPSGNGNGNATLSAVWLLAKMDHALVTNRAADFVASALRTAAGTDAAAWLNAYALNEMLDIVEAVGQSIDPAVMKGLRSRVQAEVAMGGVTTEIGAPNAAPSLPDAELVTLARRLGIDVPGADKIAACYDSRWIGDGWAVLSLPIIAWDTPDAYFGIEIARFAGYAFDHKKVENYLTLSLTTESTAAGFMQLYYAVKALKTLNAALSAKQQQVAEATCLQLGNQFLGPGTPADELPWTYAALLGKELGFDWPEEVQARLLESARALKDTMAGQTRGMTPEDLRCIWAAQGESESVITKEEIAADLQSLYDAQTGAYSARMISKEYQESGLAQQGAEPQYVPYPSVSSTYGALELLRELGQALPDREKTLAFVTACRQDFGFADTTAYTVSQSNFEATFAALMLLQDR